MQNNSNSSSYFHYNTGKIFIRIRGLLFKWTVYGETWSIFFFNFAFLQHARFFAAGFIAFEKGAEGFVKWNILRVPVSFNVMEWCDKISPSTADGKNGLKMWNVIERGTRSWMRQKKICKSRGKLKIVVCGEWCLSLMEYWTYFTPLG